MNYELTKYTFIKMLQEEWRIHTELFGGLRFALFPVFLLVLTAAGVMGLQLLDVTTTLTANLVHVLVFLFGLHTGSIAFVGREAVRNLIGDITFIAYSARTLPVSKQFLVGMFVAKDVVYYSLLFILPITAAFVLILPIHSVAVLWLSLTGVFLLGIVVTLLLAAVKTRTRVEQIGIGVFAVLLPTVAVLGNVDVIKLTPYAFFAEPSVNHLLTGFIPLVVITVIGILLYDMEVSSTKRTDTPAFKRLSQRLEYLHPITVKTLIDVRRSSGGIGKVIFSGVVIYGFGVIMLRFIDSVLPMIATTPIAFAPIIGLIAFTSYNWITQFDSLTDYIQYPFDSTDVYRGKFEAFVLISLPTGILFYLLYLPLSVWTPLTATAGGIIVVAIQFYLFGLTARIAGFSPNEFLFDTVKYVTFTFGVAIVLIPVLIAGMAVEQVGELVVIGVTGLSVFSGLVGYLLYKQASKTQRESA